MESAFAEIENADPNKTNPGKSATGWQDAALDHFLFETRGTTSRYRPYSLDIALTYSAVYRCISVLSQSLVTAGWQVFELTGGGRGKRQVEISERSEAGMVAWLLAKSPDGETTAVAWREACYAEAIAKGNSYSFIKRDVQNRISEFWRIENSRVIPFRADGDLYYYVKNQPDDGKGELLTPNQVLHLRGPSPDGLVGYSPITLARRTIELGLSQETFGETFFQRGPMPGGVLSIPANIKQEDKDQLRKDFQRVYGGSQNAGKVVVLSGQQTFTKLDLNNTDAQFLESRRFSVEDVCRWFGVPPHKCYDLTRATFSNIEHQSIEFVQDSILPWAVRFEAEADMKFFGRINQGRNWTKHNLRGHLRGDSQAQTDSLTKQVSGAMRTPNEAREQLDLNPVEGGDTLLVQGAMIPLERALEEPPEPQPQTFPAADPTEPDEDLDEETEDDTEDDSPPANALAPVRLLFSETCARLLRVEADKARRAVNRGKVEEWRRDYYRDHASVSSQYLPTVQAALTAFDSSVDARKLAEFIAVAHNGYGSQANDLLKALADKDHPGDFADQCVKLLWRKRK